MAKLVVFLMVVLGFCPVSANELRVFAFAEGSLIEGEAYFADGAKAADIDIHLFRNGQIVAWTLTDETGAFFFDDLIASAYLITAYAGDDQREVHYEISAEEMGLRPESTHVLPAVGYVANQKNDWVQEAGEAELVYPISDMIAEAVAQQLIPLQEQMAQLITRHQRQDTLASVGYVLGLIGLICLMLSRLHFKAAVSA